MYCPMGMHQGAMSVLLAFQHGLTCGIDVAEKLGISYSDGTADYWLQHTPGAAFRSSVGRRIQVATLSGLSIKERRAFADVDLAFHQCAADLFKVSETLSRNSDHEGMEP
jgi:hypothetical protein